MPARQPHPLPSSPQNFRTFSSRQPVNIGRTKNFEPVASKKTLASRIAKGVFDPECANGLAFDEIMKEAKRWLQKNVFTLVEILCNMDIRGGTLNYEGLSVLNDVEAAAA